MLGTAGELDKLRGASRDGSNRDDVLVALTRKGEVGSERVDLDEFTGPLVVVRSGSVHDHVAVGHAEKGRQGRSRKSLHYEEEKE